LVLFGATGFTGRLAAIYIAKQYFGSSQTSEPSSKFTWALAGRRKDALEKLRDELVQITGNQSLTALPIIIADSSNFTSIEKMVQQCRVVITTSGPFARYSRYLLHCCAMFGTHYCDITGMFNIFKMTLRLFSFRIFTAYSLFSFKKGETDFVREMIDLYDDYAKESGAWIVNSCGNDCVPWDQLCKFQFSDQTQWQIKLLLFFISSVGMCSLFK
jgi:saccharopine dehydrogenase (NAD+, L-glutamate forming)